ncbi:MAG: divergent polysaccharide deacetylase family protein [Pseudomonadota bacterium]
MKAWGLALAALSAILTAPAGAQLLDEEPPGLLEAQRDERPKIAIVVDDLGLDWARFRSSNQLPVPVTLAFLPYGRDAQAMLDSADPRHGIILHMPMEPKTRKHDAGPGMVRRGPTQRVKKDVETNLGKLSGYDGVSNHTGSAITEDRGAMGAVLSTVTARDLYFLDSKTTPRSTARSVASKSSAVVIEGSLFLDGDFGRGGSQHVTRQLDRLLDIAEHEGSAIGIGHPYPTTLSAISDWVDAHADDVRFVTADMLAADARLERLQAGI